MLIVARGFFGAEGGGRGHSAEPPPPRHALCLISRGGPRKSPCGNRDFIVGRAIRAGARSSRILSAFFFIDIDLAGDLFASRCIEHNGTFERKESTSRMTPDEPGENESVKLWPIDENKSSIGQRKDLRVVNFVIFAKKRSA